jgi:hypothetical protein
MMSNPKEAVIVTARNLEHRHVRAMQWNVPIAPVGYESCFEVSNGNIDAK